jgi:hypothetical protein
MGEGKLHASLRLPPGLRRLGVGVYCWQSWTEREFRKRIRVTFNTIKFLSKRLGPYLKKDVTRIRVTIPVQKVIAMSLSTLSSGDGLPSIGDLYGVYKNTSSKIVRKFCWDVRKYL